jgi:hypothetical protein
MPAFLLIFAMKMSMNIIGIILVGGNNSCTIFRPVSAEPIFDYLSRNTTYQESRDGE